MSNINKQFKKIIFKKKYSTFFPLLSTYILDIKEEWKILHLENIYAGYLYYILSNIRLFF